MNKFIYIGIFLVIIIIGVLLYQKQKASNDIVKNQQLLLAQNPNTQFSGGQGGGWFAIAQQLVAGTTSNLNKK